jgi:hypothetical protein
MVVWLIPFGIMLSKSQLDRGIFNIYFLNYEKLESFVETLTKKLLVFKDQFCGCNMDFYSLILTE